MEAGARWDLLLLLDLRMGVPARAAGRLMVEAEAGAWAWAWAPGCREVAMLRAAEAGTGAGA